MTKVDKIGMMQAPYRTHSAELLSNMRANCEVVYFYDHSIAEKIDGKWIVTYPGNEAERWVK